MFFMQLVFLNCVGAFIDCPTADPWSLQLTTYLFVQGSFNLLQLLLCTLWSLSSVAVRNTEEFSPSISSVYIILLMSFLLSWTVVWTTWLSVSLDDWKKNDFYCSMLYITTIFSLSLHWVIVLLLYASIFAS